MNTNSNQKKLSLSQSPIITFLDYAHTLSIIRNNNETDAWFYCNYIQLFYQKRSPQSEDVFKLFITDSNGAIWDPILPWLNYQKIQRKLIKDLGANIVDLLICAIKDNYYVNLYWDEFYVPNGITQLEHHLSHVTFVYGYNLDEKYFYSAGFKKSGLYEHFKISFTNFEQAYNNAINNEGPRHWQDIILMQFNDNFSFTFDINILIKQLENLYLSTNPLSNYSNHINTTYDIDHFNNGDTFVYGMDSYKPLQSFIESMPTAMKQSVKLLHALWEHKRVMVDRIQYLKDMNYLPNNNIFALQYKEIEEQAKVLRNLYIKYRISKGDQLIERMVTILNKIYEQEMIILPLIIKELKMCL